jgi:hypothetical protein
MNERRQPAILTIYKNPQIVAFITRGDPSGCRGSLPADLNVHVRVGGDVPVPSRVAVRPAVRGDNDEILIPARIDERHRAVKPGPAAAGGENKRWPATDVAAQESAGEAVYELMKPRVGRSNHGSRCLIQDAAYDQMTSSSRPIWTCRL